MKRMLPAFLSAVLVHAVVLTADITGLMHQSSTAPTAQVITMRLVERAPYFPPAMRPLPGPPPLLPPAPPEPALKRPAIKPVPVVKPSKPIARKPLETRVPASPPAQPPPVPDAPEPQPEPSPPAAGPAFTATGLAPSAPDSSSPAIPMDPDAAPADHSSAASTVVMATPRYSDNPQPVYPAIARTRGYEGIVVLDVFVGQDGRVKELRISQSSNHRLLDRSAIKAVEGWRFEPGRKGDKVVAMWVRVPVNFRLK